MCPELPMGDRFVDLGPWRLAAWDDEHLSIANRAPWRYFNALAMGKSSMKPRTIVICLGYVHQRWWFLMAFEARSMVISSFMEPYWDDGDFLRDLTIKIHQKL